MTKGRKPINPHLRLIEGTHREDRHGDAGEAQAKVKAMVGAFGKLELPSYLKGHARVVTRESPNAVYDQALASFGASGGLFSQRAAPGFIELWSLQSRMAWRLHNE